MTYNVNDLIALTKRKKCKYLLFWGHKTRDREVNKTCLSQWYHSPFKHGDDCYSTAEHYMMVQKAIMFQAYDLAREILKDDDPSRAKALGRRVPNFDRSVWDEKKFYIVVAGNELKFSQNPELLSYLHSTGKRILVEASPNDQVWGIGLTEDHPDATNPTRWKGENQLGFALMKVRDQILRRKYPIAK